MNESLNWPSIDMTSPTSPVSASNGGQEAPISVQLQGGYCRETVTLRAPSDPWGKRSTVDALREAAANFVSRKVNMNTGINFQFYDDAVRSIKYSYGRRAFVK